VVVSTTAFPVPVSRNLWIRNENNAMKLRNITGNYSTRPNWNLRSRSLLG